MNSQPLLSICIATRNRGVYLARALERLQAIKGADIELLVIDGASTDNTSEVLETAANADPRLRYETLEINGGIDRDFNLSVEMAQGRYVWLCSDDDDILPGSIERLRCALSDGPSLVVVDAVVMSADLQEVLTPNRMGLSAQVRVAPGDSDTLMKLAGLHLSFIGGVVIDRALWMSRQREPYFGSYFAHFGVIFQSPLPKHALVLNEPCIAIRYGNESWTARSFEIWMWLWPELVWAMPSCSDEAKRTVCLQHPWRSTRQLLAFRARGALSIKEYGRLRELTPLTWTDHARIWAVLVIPGALVNWAITAHLKRSAHPSKQALIDLKNSRFACPGWRR